MGLNFKVCLNILTYLNIHDFQGKGLYVNYLLDGKWQKLMIHLCRNECYISRCRVESREINLNYMKLRLINLRISGQVSVNHDMMEPFLKFYEKELTRLHKLYKKDFFC